MQPGIRYKGGLRGRRALGPGHRNRSFFFCFPSTPCLDAFQRQHKRWAQNHRRKDYSCTPCTNIGEESPAHRRGTASSFLCQPVKHTRKLRVSTKLQGLMHTPPPTQSHSRSNTTQGGTCDSCSKTPQHRSIPIPLAVSSTMLTFGPLLQTGSAVSAEL